MIKNSFCCPSCFNNEFIKTYINENYEKDGNCPYCEATEVNLISLKKMGIYIRGCIDKEFEGYDDGTGAMYDSEVEEYVGLDGEKVTTYSIREILKEEEVIFSEATIEKSLLEDLFENLYSDREIKKGAEDKFDDIDSQNWVIKGNLYGSEQTKAFQRWEFFKHIIKHYNRFFDSEEKGIRSYYLTHIERYMHDFTTNIPSKTVFYRVRRKNNTPFPTYKEDMYSEMGPPPAAYAKTNRMSPAGIPYLYLASDRQTALKECRIKKGEKAFIAELVSTQELHIIDLSDNKYLPQHSSIFDPEYDHDYIWMRDFCDSFIKEISEPVSDGKDDHSYEYAATQLIAEYYRTKGYDGICYNSSIASGKNYVFFMGPDPQYTIKAYPYPFGSDYCKNLPIIKKYTDSFQISRISFV